MQQSPSVQPCESPSAHRGSTPAPGLQSELGCHSQSRGFLVLPPEHSHLRELSQCNGKIPSTPGNQWRLWLSGFYIHSCHRPPCQSLFVLDFPLQIWDNSISSACHVYFQWFSGALFTGLLSALLGHCRHYCTINRRSNTSIHRLWSWSLKFRISLEQGCQNWTYLNIFLYQNEIGKHCKATTGRNWTKIQPQNSIITRDFWDFWEGADIYLNTYNPNILTPMCCIGICGLQCFSSGREGARVFQQRGSRAPCPGWGGHPAQADGAASSKLPSRAVSRQPSGPGLTQRPLSWWMVLLLPHGHQGKSPTNDARAGLER